MTYFIVLVDKSEHVDLIKNKLQKSYELTYSHHSINNVFFVASRHTAEEISKSIGITKKEDGCTGAIFKLSPAYAGYSSRSLWDWLGQVEDGQ